MMRDGVSAPIYYAGNCGGADGTCARIQVQICSVGLAGLLSVSVGAPFVFRIALKGL
jgi:hypothetical protein